MRWCRQATSRRGSTGGSWPRAPWRSRRVTGREAASARECDERAECGSVRARTRGSSPRRAAKAGSTSTRASLNWRWRWHGERPPRPRRRTRSASLAAIEKSRRARVESPTHQSLSDPRTGAPPRGLGSVPGGRRAAVVRASSPGGWQKRSDDARAPPHRRTRRRRTSVRDRSEGRSEAACDIARTRRGAKSPRFPAKRDDVGRFLDFLVETGDTTPRGGRSGSDSPLKARVARPEPSTFCRRSVLRDRRARDQFFGREI